MYGFEADAHLEYPQKGKKATMTEMQTYEPRGNRVHACQVTSENAEAVAKELGCAVREEAKPGDPSDVAMWFIVPMVDSTPHLLITTEGPIVGREKDTIRLVAWKTKREFDKLYQLVRKIGYR